MFDAFRMIRRTAGRSSRLAQYRFLLNRWVSSKDLVTYLEMYLAIRAEALNREPPGSFRYDTSTFPDPRPPQIAHQMPLANLMLIHPVMATCRCRFPFLCRSSTAT